MVQQGKSHRYGKPVAPYRRAVAANSGNKASSFFKRMKSLFNQETGVYHSNESSNEYNAKGGIDRIVTPGGFFTGNVSPNGIMSSVNDKGHNESSQKLIAGSSSFCVSEDQGSDEDSFAADTSNAKLADFFSKKGDMPLTDIEMEGVLSLMKKASKFSNNCHRSSANSTIGNDSIDLRGTRVLKRSRTPSIAASSFKAPSFVPRYDNSIGSQSLGNASVRSTSSRRRVFDYSNFPTPYKTVVYKYSAADSREGSRISSASSNSEAHGEGFTSQSKHGNIASPPKKLSNTASALVSLLDKEPSKSESVTQFSNPYSSLVNPIRDYKKTVSPALEEPTAALEKGLQRGASGEISDAKELPDSEPLPKQRQKNQPKSSLDRYKPTRSSSLRSSMTTVENAAQDDRSCDEEKTEGSKSPHVPSAAKFTFTLKKTGDEAAATEDEPVTDQNVFQLSSNGAKADLMRPVSDGRKEETNNGGIFGQRLGEEARSIETHKQADSGSVVQRDSMTPNPVKCNSYLVGKDFEFGQPFPSGVMQNSIDEGKVDEFRSMFVF